MSKSKVTVFSRGKIRNRPEFYFGENKLNVVDHYKNLGLNFNFNGKFTVAKKELYDKGNRAMFSLLRKSRQLQLPIDIQLQLFAVLVKPVLLYGCEVWAHEGTDILEKLHLRFCKYVLGVNKSTCTRQTNRYFIDRNKSHYRLIRHSSKRDICTCIWYMVNWELRLSP